MSHPNIVVCLGKGTPRKTVTDFLRINIDRSEPSGTIGHIRMIEKLGPIEIDEWVEAHYDFAPYGTQRDNWGIILSLYSPWSWKRIRDTLALELFMMVNEKYAGSNLLFYSGDLTVAHAKGGKVTFDNRIVGEFHQAYFKQDNVTLSTLETL